jgi:hypothetical protein
MGRLKRNLRIPKEHGAWGMLYVPLALAVAAAGVWNVRVVWLALAVTLVFLARESVLAWWRARVWGRDPDNSFRMMLLYLALAAVAGAPLVAFERLWGLAAFGAAAAALLVWNGQQAAKREERTVPTEVLGIAGLTLTAPAAHYVALGRWEATGLWLWAASALYFTSSVFYVKLRVLTAHPKRPQELESVRRWCFFYHAGLAAAVVALAALGVASAAIVLAYAPILARAFWRLWRPARRLVLKHVGVLEIVYSVVFLVFGAIALRGPR